MNLLIDLKTIEKNLTDEQVIKLVTKLGSDTYIDTPSYIQFKTICHNEDPGEASLKLYYYKRNKKFHCYTDCGDNFNIFELFKRRYELLGKEYNFYKDIVLVVAEGQNLENDFVDDFSKKYVSDFDKYKVNRFDNILIDEISENLLNVFTYYPTPEWLNDGISENAIKEYNILYSINSNKIIIPHYNDEGKLIGIRGRALNEKDIEIGKYMPVTIEGKIYAHPLGYNLYGLDKVKENIKKSGLAIVAESEKSALQFYTMFGKENNYCVAACGSSLHAYQVELLKKYNVKKILIAFDKEGKDWKEQEKYFYKLEKMCLQYKNYAEMGFIYDTKNLLNLKDSPTDRGKETFLTLYKEAHWIK